MRCSTFCDRGGAIRLLSSPESGYGEDGLGVEINLGGGLGPEHGAVVAIGSKEGAEEVT